MRQIDKNVNNVIILNNYLNISLAKKTLKTVIKTKKNNARKLKEKHKQNLQKSKEKLGF